MGDNATVQARSRLPPAVPGAAVGDLGDHDKRSTGASPRASSVGHRFAARTRGGDGGGGSPRGSPRGTPPGTALERKKSYHPELLAGASGADCPASASGRRELLVLRRDADDADLGHRMEVIHLNRTCTSVDLASPKTASMAAARDPRGATSDANLTDEEKVHRVRHQVSFAQDVGHAGPGRPACRGQDLVNALRSGLRAAPLGAPGEEDSDQDERPYEDDDDDVLLEHSTSPDSDVDYLAVRPSLASTQLTQLGELRGPH